MVLDYLFGYKNRHSNSSFDEHKSSEKPIRSIVKAISWRVLGTLDTIIISWIITGEFKLALSIGSIELITKMILYFFHERVWNIVKWGKR